LPTSPTNKDHWALTRLIVLAVGIALIVRMFIFQPFNIPSGSMRPNLLVGDFLYVSKMSYGYSRASLVWPLTKLPLRGRLFAKFPERGDVVVFKNKKDSDRAYVKRLIGLPGDEIYVRRGTVYINNIPIRRDYLGTASGVCDNEYDHAIPVFRETVANNMDYIVHECHGERGFLDDRGPYRVPSGHYFMLGDNRDQSRDSRVQSEVGTIPFEDLIGEAKHVVISVDGSQAKFWQVWKWPAAIRGTRFFKTIE